MLELHRGVQFTNHFSYHSHHPHHAHHPHHPHHPHGIGHNLEAESHLAGPAYPWNLEAVTPDEFDADIKPFLSVTPAGVGSPYAEIIEHPQQRGFRFRYRCEGPSHGGLQGEHTERGNKTFPMIKIHNYCGSAIIMVTLVTDEKIPKTHAHELMGKHCTNGICVVNARDTGASEHIVTFPNLGILHITKKKVESILKERLLEVMRLDHHLRSTNFNETLPEGTDEMKDIVSKKAKEDCKKMLLNVVRLSFTIYLQDAKGNYSHKLDPLISKAIYDSKCPGVAGLNICRMDRNAGSSTGNEEVFLLCDKVQKDDILVRFFEHDEEKHVKWEAFGDFGPSDVHRQYAIVFKTPAYRDPLIATPVQVMVQLRRISDQELSEPKTFTYFPQQIDAEQVESKKRKIIDTRCYQDNSMSNRQTGSTGGSAVSFYQPPATTNNMTGRSNNDGRINNLSFMQDLHSLASGASDIGYRDVLCDSNMAGHASSLVMHPEAFPSHITPQQMLPTKIPVPNMAFVNPQMKPLDITGTGTAPTPDVVPDELKELLMEFCTSEDLLVHTAQLNVSTVPEHKILPQLPLQHQVYQRHPHQFIPEQLQQGFPQMAAQTQQAMQNATLQQFSPNQHAIQQSPTAYNPQGPTQSPPYVQGQTPPYRHSQTPPYSHGQTPPYTQGQTPPYTQGQTPPYTTPSTVYSPSTTQYSPASQQTFSPASQHTQQSYSPTMSQQAYSPGSTQSFSPGSQHHQQQNQFSPAPLQQPSPPAPTQPYIFSENDLTTDGGDVDAPTNNAPANTIAHDGDDIICDSPEFIDPDLEVDAIPMASNTGHTLSDDFHRQHSLKHDDDDDDDDDEALISDLQKLTLKPSSTKGSDNIDNSYVKGDLSKNEKLAQSSKTTVHRLNVHIPTTDKQSVAELQSAFNVAKRSVVALHNYTKTHDPVFLSLCHRNLISVQDDLGDTALHMAIIYRQTDVATKLLRVIEFLPHARTEIVNTWNILRQTPLQLAVLTGQAHLIPHLLAQGGDRHLVDKRGNTPLHLAARLGHADCVNALFNGDGPSARIQLNMLNFEGFSALHLTIHHGHLDVMKALVEQGADVNQRDGRSGRTALHHAVEADNHAMAGYILLKTEVDVNASAYDKNTALHMAVGRRLYAMAQLLVESDGNTEAESLEFISSEYENDIVEDSNNISDDGATYSDDVAEDCSRSVANKFVRPIDMAAGDEKMLRILQHATPDPGFEDDCKLQSDDQGDLCQLDEDTLEALSEKLDTVMDHQAGWSALAKQLGLMKAMDCFRDQASPTRHLLETYKAENGTLMELRRVLNSIGRYDAAALVDNLVAIKSQLGLNSTAKLESEKNNLSGQEIIDKTYHISSLESTLA